MEPLFNRAVIAGVGLIGGSLGISGKQAGVFKHVVGLGRSKQNLDTALSKGLVDEVTTDLQGACKGADLFMVAAPVESIADISLAAAQFLSDGCVITDAGSVKGDIVEKMEKDLPSRLHFVGGHPVAGTEKSGAQAAFETLYKNRYTILTPTENTDKNALDRVRKMWEAVGSDVRIMTPKEHDEALAVISHLPHFAAYALVETIMEADPEKTIRRFVAGGFKDTTRIAASDPKMWRDIFSMNRDPLLAHIEEFERSISAFKRDIQNGDFDTIEKRLERIKAARLGMDDHCE